ncbi:MAG: AAA family ATPase [Cytophagaceae bacterium]|nr:AAA family ATPase [Cytophagaceae bacterium]
MQRLIKLMGIEVDEKGALHPKQPALPERRYTLETALADANSTPEFFEKLLRLLDRRRQIILQGAPGTGKTYLARILQRYLTDATDDQADVVQFHPSYAYEDFVEGYRPIEGGGAVLKPGIFRLFCEKAHISHKAGDGKKYVLLLDEINRGNLAKIFGELLYLLEYRNQRVKLAYRPEEDFHIPENVYLIGTMNTADRSLSLVDYALRRRFSFVTLRTDYSLIARQPASGFSPERLAENVQELNRTLALTPSLGEGFAIGHSYFVNPRLPLDSQSLGDIWEYELSPLLAEYFLDEEVRVEEFKKLFFKGL